MLQLQWPIVFLTGLYSHIIMINTIIIIVDIIIIITIVVVVVVVIIIMSMVLEPVSVKFWVFFVFTSSFRSSYVLLSLGLLLVNFGGQFMSIHFK
jgi:hypothetical protein